MGKSYPPGIHQQMIFECADGWVHASIMSGLTPTKSQDEILGLDDAPDPFTFMALPRRGARDSSTPSAARSSRSGSATTSSPRSRSTTTRSRRSSRPTSSSRTRSSIANDMVQTVVDPVVGETTQIGTPLHMFGTPDRDPGPATHARPAQRRDPEGAGTDDARARGRPARRLRAVPRGAVRADDHRRPRRRGHQGRARHRRRHADGDASRSSAASAASATSR